MGQDNNMNDQGRRPEQQQNNPSQQQPNQQNQQRDPQNLNQGQSGQRIATDGDGRTRDPNDPRPTDDGGRGEPVQR